MSKTRGSVELEGLFHEKKFISSLRRNTFKLVLCKNIKLSSLTEFNKDSASVLFILGIFQKLIEGLIMNKIFGK